MKKILFTILLHLALSACQDEPQPLVAIEEPGSARRILLHQTIGWYTATDEEDSATVNTKYAYRENSDINTVISTWSTSLLEHSITHIYSSDNLLTSTVEMSEGITTTTNYLWDDLNRLDHKEISSIDVRMKITYTYTDSINFSCKVLNSQRESEMEMIFKMNSANNSIIGYSIEGGITTRKIIYLYDGMESPYSLSNLEHLSDIEPDLFGIKLGNLLKKSEQYYDVENTTWKDLLVFENEYEYNALHLPVKRSQKVYFTPKHEVIQRSEMIFEYINKP